VFRHLPELDWIVVSTSYADEFYAPLERLRHLFLATLGVALVLIVLISWKLSSHIATPLRRLTGHFQTGADGDLSARVEADSNDEIGRLGRCFNSFMARLQLYRDSLESEIRERKRAESEREQLEQQVRQKMKMEAIGQLAGGVAHDFNNILTAIRGNAELLKMDADRGGDEAEMLHEIMRASGRAADLTAQLLAFGRRGKMQVTRFDLHDAIRETVRLLEHSVDKRIELHLDLQAEKSVIEGDATQIHNALLNLALNARDAMPEGGSLRFATRNVPVEESDVTDSRGREPEYVVEVSVADTGVGIEPELRDRIFEPFFTTKQVGEGSGLGLAGVYGAMENHNGRVLLESTPGQGATFRLVLPVFAKAEASETEPGQTASGGVQGTGTILVVEDDDVVRNYVTRMLKTFGYDALAASDGAEGLDCFRTRHRQIDAVILDVTMPHMDGATALSHMRQIDPSTPVILASGYRQGRGSPDVGQEGAAGFVPKPYTAETLTRELDRVLRDRRGASRATTQDG
jgi:signal transduction histidine kinase/CheY-like chemotaxis protein